jgi:hypothetical protein
VTKSHASARVEIALTFESSQMPKIKFRWLAGQRAQLKECDGVLHEAISNLYTWEMAYEKSPEKEAERSLRIIVDRFIECGVKIPN